MYKVYILYSSRINKYYVGHTENLELRLDRHNQGSSKFTSQTNDWQIVYSEDYLTKGDAMKRENEIKKKKSRKYIEELVTQ